MTTVFSTGSCNDLPARPDELAVDHEAGVS
ncbi:hypothetical protein HNR40_000910 [Nonomuraea endophytica]|uniref:Uncharacterized protein n=1 Tax=Nonomuraea endophytica TaxID=714136 RepID=A0A7W7ZXA0_9ACTN|nr:hypothetical protein [Nonomuraea endophytica]